MAFLPTCPSALRRAALPWLLLAAALPAAAQDGLDGALAADVLRLAREAGAAAFGNLASTAAPRVDVEVGQLDARLRLAPCAQIRPYLPAGQRAWGRTRVGLRCESGPVRWNVYLPVTVKVYARALVLPAALPAGTTLEAAHLAEAEVDLAAAPARALRQAPQVLGRVLARPLPAGHTLREGDLKARQFFAAGDSVRIVARGAGYSVAGEGQAVSAGIEGQPARIRTDSGRIITAQPVSERLAEVAL